MSLKAPKFVASVRQLIYWQYANLIAKSAGFEGNWGFTTSRYKKLLSGEMQWSSSIRDYEQALEMGRVCVYCGAKKDLSMDHIIPISKAGVDPRIAHLLNSVDNCICACKKCNSSKGDRDVFEWFGHERLDEIPKLVFSKFLKLVYALHETQGTLDLRDPNMDGVLDIYDLGTVITNLISKLSMKAGKKGP
ncbi:MAG: HNH endonuclease [Candidatus Aminicenantes bacterium]|nr:HNH endonuclease [Candidatus Aminicenantes bacterium]